ncbi:MAG: hypothetical protein HY280_00030 [Nitrospinae bacterium]|nr:hypothetical protein [Nitrospinota bacterium]
MRELSDKVEKLSKDYLSASKENAKLKRLLHSAEAMISGLSKGIPARSGGTGFQELTRQVEKMRHERKLIKEKVGKMSHALEKLQPK